MFISKPVDATLTLRDRFAVEAMNTMLSRIRIDEFLEHTVVSDIGDRSYLIADAMLTARERNERDDDE